MSLGTAAGAAEIVYDMPDMTDANIMAAHTQVDDENLVDVVSSSFGECELDFTAAANGGVDFASILKQFHALFQQGNAQGITFLASSGDNGAPGMHSARLSIQPYDRWNRFCARRFESGGRRQRHCCGWYQPTKRGDSDSQRHVPPERERGLRSAGSSAGHDQQRDVPRR